MVTMKVSEILQALEEMQARLTEHQKLWGDSLDRTIPSFPLRNRDELNEQSRWLSRRAGAMRPFIDRFDSQWLMHHPATGGRWDALDSAVGMADVAQVKGPSIRTTIQKLDQIIGRLQMMDPNEVVPDDPSQPVRLGLGADRIMLVYLDHLHPFIAHGCSQLYLDGHYAQAVEEASKAVSEYIRKATGLTTDGVALAQTAFSPKNPMLAFSDLADETKRNEQIGFMEMLVGFAKGIRNPLAHTHGKLEEAQKAFECLVMASLFCRRVDDATPSVTAP